MALGAATSPLEYRIRRIVGAQKHNYIRSSLPGILALGLALACLAIYSSPASGSAPQLPARVEYPESARANGIQGTVPVEVKIDDQGNVSHAKAVGGPRQLRRPPWIWPRRNISARNISRSKTGQRSFSTQPPSRVSATPAPVRWLLP